MGRKQWFHHLLLAHKSIRGGNKCPVTKEISGSSNAGVANDQRLETVLQRGHDTHHLCHTVQTENRVGSRGRCKQRSRRYTVPWALLIPETSTRQPQGQLFYMRLWVTQVQIGRRHRKITCIILTGPKNRRHAISCRTTTEFTNMVWRQKAEGRNTSAMGATGVSLGKAR